MLHFAAGILAGVALAFVLPTALAVFRLEKRNFRGDPIGGSGGLIFLVGAVGWLLFPWPRLDLIAAAAAGFGLLGLLDDRWGTAEHKGLRGHLAAAKSGKLTTGLIKAAGGAALAVALAWWIRAGWPALLGAPLIALSANLLNLLDLRPLRALKAFWVLGGGMAAFSPPSLALLLGLSVPYAVLEAKRRVMLGDTGSNGLGAALGAAAVFALPLWGQGVAVAALAAFHLWTEKHSLTSWIETHPFAGKVDAWGWTEPEP